MSASRLHLSLMVSLAFLVGCHGGAPRSLDYDPLVGGSPIRGTPAGSIGTPSRSRETDPLVKGDLPPPPPGNTTSPAALTLGEVGALPDPNASRASVALGGPRRVGDRTSRPEAPERSPIAPVSGSQSFEELQQALRSRGVTWQQLKMLKHDEWEFRCAIPDPQQRNLQDSFTARAPGANGVAAMRLVLEQIDHKYR